MQTAIYDLAVLSVHNVSTLQHALSSVEKQGSVTGA